MVFHFASRIPWAFQSGTPVVKTVRLGRGERWGAFSLLRITPAQLQWAGTPEKGK